MAEAPAFYARRGGRLADWWTLLHPPYTLWHLGYVGLGAAMAPSLDGTALAASLLAFLLAVGVAAHALDELHGRPLGTAIDQTTLRVVAAVALLGAVALGVGGVAFHGPPNWALLVAVPLGAGLVLGYNLELLDGRLHTDAVFAWGWGGFPVAVGFVAQSPTLTARSVGSAVAATLAGVALASAQRSLSTAARTVRRRVADVNGTLTFRDGRTEPLTKVTLVAPHERALLALAWAVPLLAAGLLLSKA